MPTLAAVKDGNPRVAPTLTPGRVTPQGLLRRERFCKEYFRVKNVADTKKVLSRLRDFRIAVWAEDNEAMLKELDLWTS